MRKQDLMKKIVKSTENVWNQPGVRRAVRRNLAKLLVCGTPALGWEVYASENEEKRCYHTCKSRFCASCGYRATLLWLAYQAAVLPDIPYRGIVLTMPSQLWGIFKRNRHLLHDLPALGAAVIQQFIKTKHGASVLIIVVPHTFGGDLKFKTHMHILVSAGGYSGPQERWIESIELHEDALMRMWRDAVMGHLRRALKAEVLTSNLPVRRINAILAGCDEFYPRWHIWIDEIASKSHFFDYAARYIRRPPLASWRLLEVTDQDVAFIAKDTMNERPVRMRLPLLEFLRLLVAHVPEWYQHSVRYFGLLAPRARGRMQAAIFALLGQRKGPRPPRLSWSESLWIYFGVNPLIDSFGQTMRWVRRERPLIP